MLYICAYIYGLSELLVNISKNLEIMILHRQTL